MRTNQWSDTLVGSQLEVMHHPLSSRANYSTARELFIAGHGNANDPIGGQMIHYHFNKAAELDPNDKMSYLGLVYWACTSNRPIKQEWINKLEGRLKLRQFSLNDLNLTRYLQKSIIDRPGCLSRQQTTALLKAGSVNEKIPLSARSAFLHSAADYELLVSKDISSSIRFLRQAAALSPRNSSLQKKLRNFETVEQRLTTPSTR